MIPKERVISAIEGGELEAPPVLPLIGAHSAVLANRDPREAFKDGRLMAELQMRAVKFYQPDGIFHYMDLTLEAETLGAEIEFKGYFPVVVRHCIPEEVEFDVGKGRIGEFVRAITLLDRELGSRLFIGAYVTGPLTMAVELLGSKEGARWLVGRGSVVGELLPKLSKFASDYARALVDAGADGVMILEPYCALASPKAFGRVILFINEVCHAVSSKGAYPILHICGNTTHLLSLYPEVSASAYQVDSVVSLEKAREELGDRCLMGNVSTTLLLYGEEESITSTVRRCIEKAGTRYYILSAGCEVPPETPPENLKALIKAARGRVKHIIKFLTEASP